MQGAASKLIPVPSRSYSAQVLRDTLRRPGAKLGVVWIGLLALASVFAPFVASSYPILMKQHDRWNSPLLAHLTAVDVVLLLTFAAVPVVACLPRPNAGRKALLLTGFVLLTTLLAWWLVPQRGAVDLGIYRELEAAGRFQYVLRAPIPYSPSDRLFDRRFRLQPPSSAHRLGTDENGADVLSQIIHASRIAMSIGFVSTGIAVLIGVTIGGIMGYFSGRVDILGMRVIEIVDAIPTLFLLLMAVAIFGHNLYMMMAIIGFTGWVHYARFTRAEYLKLRQQDFVQAAIASGFRLRSILFRHMLPNGISPVLVGASFGVASAILLESTLSFLGLGLVDEPSWGQLLKQSIGVSGFQWWTAIFPGIAIFLTVYSYNLIGEALRDALDPRLRNWR